MGAGWGEGWREQAYSTYNCALRVHNTQPSSMPPDQPQGPRNTGMLSFGLWCLQYCKTKLGNTNKVEHVHLSQRNTVGLYKRTREASFPQNSMRKWNCPCLFLLAAQVWKLGSTTHASRQHKLTAKLPPPRGHGYTPHRRHDHWRREEEIRILYLIQRQLFKHI